MLVVSLVSFSMVLRRVCIFLLLVCVLMWLCVIADFLFLAMCSFQFNPQSKCSPRYFTISV